MRAIQPPRWLRVLLTNRRLQAALGIMLVLAASVGVSGVLLRRAHATGTTRYVATTGADSGTCGAIGTPCLTIQQAITNSAATGDTISVAAGTYPLTSRIAVTKAVTILGAKAGIDARTRSTSGESIVDASTNADGYGFDVQTTNVTIDGFTIQGATIDCVNGISGSGGLL
ncbi:MAG TPA: hypothetical protein VIG30_04430, partial [Ktedonobacterales bacterium]